MSTTPKDVLIDAKIAEVDAAIADERIVVADKGCTVTEAKTTVDRLTASPMTGSANRMTSKLYEKLEKFSSSSKTIAFSFALTFIGSFIEEEAAAERFKERMQRDGYVPVGSEYEVSGEYSTGQQNCSSGDGPIDSGKDESTSDLSSI